MWISWRIENRKCGKGKSLSYLINLIISVMDEVEKHAKKWMKYQEHINFNLQMHY